MINMAQNGLARELPQQTPGATTPVHKTTTVATPNPAIKTQRVAFSMFEKVLCVGLSLVVFSLAIMLVSTNITATNAESELQTVQEKVSKVQAKNTSAAQEISELSSRSRLNKIAKQYGLSLNNGSIRNVYK
ncbi:cell division protein FtsL [Lactobacillus pentosus]|nr:cell division protein FtsL [Lactiplantibacillus pentosus]MCT3286331.1 cell division protein FtsL [Lactiplantibacillus pentosus]MCT3292640.1 cell division protein FtsL [Lactiplantibacillus pentosus]MPQ19466.1 cell division protein FtsL [Lactiplantibacillus pentosus]